MGGCDRPVTGALADAVEAGGEAELRRRLPVFAWDRYADGHSLSCTLDTVDWLWETHRPNIPRYAAHHIVVEAWAEALAADRASPTIDPMTGLHTVGYLLGRIRELDRVHRTAPAPLVLLVVRWAQPDETWHHRIERLLAAAQTLRKIVRANATLAHVRRCAVIALVPDDAIARLERMSAYTVLYATNPSCRVDIFPMPDDRSAAPELLAGICDA